MDSLRLILLACGLLLLAGIYLWGITAARRGKRSGESADVDDPDEVIDQVHDARAARNVEAMTEIGDFDIDEDLERGTPAESPRQRVTPARGQDEASQPTEQRHPDEDEPETVRSAPIPQAAVRQTAGGVETADEDIDELAGLAGIRAVREPDTMPPIGQLDLLPGEKDPAAASAKGRLDMPKRKPAGHGTDATPESLVLAVTVMAREGERFQGGELRHWLESLKLRHGDMGIFHYRPPGKPARAAPTFSVANVVKPGSFDVAEMAQATTPGIAMFVSLPGPDDPSAAFEVMLRTARKLAEGLDGVVCDESRSTLTGQAINHMRERIAEYSRRQRLRY